MRCTMTNPISWIFNKLGRLFMPHLYNLNPQLKGKKKEPEIVKPKAPPKKRGRPKKGK
tara:strand:+ start:149 stop:322 length:174 start_codon:yes stop_codon:yes gene_type:complete